MKILRNSSILNTPKLSDCRWLYFITRFINNAANIEGYYGVFKKCKKNISQVDLNNHTIFHQNLQHCAGS